MAFWVPLLIGVLAGAAALAAGVVIARRNVRETRAGVREMLAAKGIISVAADGFGAPGVVVSYTADPEIQNGSKFAALGIQIAAGVPLACNEPEGFRTFRLGLFGLDKLYDVPGAQARLKAALAQREETP